MLDFWNDQFPAVYGRRFEQLRGGFQAKTPQSPPFTCAGKRQTYEDLKGKACYCGGPNDDYIAYDAAQLFPQLNNEFGGIAPAVVLTHEMGHAIQRRAEVEAASVVTELPADCFAGSWLRYTEKTADDPVDLTVRALDTSISTILVLRDQPGTSATNPQAHGLGFDRVNAFQTGYEGESRECATFPQGRAVTTELSFRTVAEARTGGNLPFSEAVRVLSESLDAYWTAAKPQVAPGKTFDRPGTPAGRSSARGELCCRDRFGLLLRRQRCGLGEARTSSGAPADRRSRHWCCAQRGLGLAVQFQAGLSSAGRAVTCGATASPVHGACT